MGKRKCKCYAEEKTKDFTDIFVEIIKQKKIRKTYTKNELKLLEQEFLKIYFDKVKSDKIKPRKKLKI